MTLIFLTTLNVLGSPGRKILIFSNWILLHIDNLFPFCSIGIPWLRSRPFSLTPLAPPRPCSSPTSPRAFIWSPIRIPSSHPSIPIWPWLDWKLPPYIHIHICMYMEWLMHPIVTNYPSLNAHDAFVSSSLFKPERGASITYVNSIQESKKVCQIMGVGYVCLVNT